MKYQGLVCKILSSGNIKGTLEGNSLTNILAHGCFSKTGEGNSCNGSHQPSSDMSNIWQYKNNNSPRVRWGCSWSILCCSCSPGPGKGSWERKCKLGLTKPVPGSRRKQPHPQPKERKGGFRIAFLLLSFCPDHLIWNRSIFFSISYCKTNCLKAIKCVCRNWKL